MPLPNASPLGAIPSPIRYPSYPVLSGVWLTRSASSFCVLASNEVTSVVTSSV